MISNHFSKAELEYSCPICDDYYGQKQLRLHLLEHGRMDLADLLACIVIDNAEQQQLVDVDVEVLERQGKQA